MAGSLFKMMLFVTAVMYGSGNGASIAGDVCCLVSSETSAQRSFLEFSPMISSKITIFLPVSVETGLY